jgi:hypothetical protein
MEGVGVGPPLFVFVRDVARGMNRRSRCNDIDTLDMTVTHAAVAHEGNVSC